jgi:hypothetical protein
MYKKVHMIVGISGFIGSGKDTIANHLVNTYNFRRESFASTLKDIVASTFGWNRELLEGSTQQSREWREQEDVWWANRLGIAGLTPRWVLQYWGTDVIRKGFHNDIWIASIENKLRNSNSNVVISDCRFPNEILAIHNQGGITIWVQKGALPQWYDIAVAANNGEPAAMQELKKFNVHTSETSWVGSKFHYIVKNDSNFDNLYAQIQEILNDAEFKNLAQSQQVSTEV